MSQNHSINSQADPQESGSEIEAAFWGSPLRSSFFVGVVAVVWVLGLLWAIDSILSTDRSRPPATALLQQKSTASTQSQKRPSKRSKGAQKASGKSQAKPSPKSSAKSQASRGERTYSFVGSVSKSVPETQARKNASGGTEGSSSASSSGGGSGKGDSESRKEGQVPELTIHVTEANIEAVAARFNYQLAAMTASGDRVLGKIEGEALRPISKGELSRYAGRARSARKHPEYQRLRRQVARQLSDLEASSIRLIYLVPKKVERRFVQAQMQVLERRGLRPENVAIMEARPQGQSIEITSIKRKR